MNGLLLSEILQTAPRFSFFDELMRVPRELTHLLLHDLFKINKIVDDIGFYLQDLNSLFAQIRDSKLELASGLDWFFEGRSHVFELIRNMESIDSIISRLLVVIDSPANAKHAQYNQLLSKFEKTSDMLFDVKKTLFIMKRKIDISINYREINDITLKSLNTEVEECLKIFLKVQQLKLSSPNKTLPNFNLQEIISKMKLNSMTMSNFSMRSITLPTFNIQDEQAYAQFSDLENKLSPLKVSIDFLPSRIEEFKSMNDNLFPSSCEEIDRNYHNLIDKWNFLNDQLNSFRAESIDSKWNEIFDYLMTHVISIVDDLTDDFKNHSNRKITKKIGENYKLCANSITIIKKAVSERILKFQSSIDLFNEGLLPKWNQLNEILSVTQRIDDISNFTANEFSGLRSFQTVRSTSSPRKQSPVKILSNLSLHNGHEPTGLGFDLGIGVEDAKVPISIKNVYKIKDFLQEFDIGKSEKPNLMNEFNLHEISEDEKSLAGLHNANEKDSTKEIQQVITGLKDINIRPNQKVKRKFKSKIPVINPKYIQLGYPIIKKIYIQSGRPSKIPTIAPNHPVFESPSLSPIMKRKTLESPISFRKLRSNSNANRSPTPRSELGFNEESIFRRPLGASTRSAKSNKSSRTSSLNFTSPLNLGNTPNLLYPQSSPSNNSPRSFRSTSPDRPSSSIGSRFDDQHLLQPLKNLKPAWK